MKSFLATLATVILCVSSVQASHVTLGKTVYNLSHDQERGISDGLIDDILAIPVGAAVGALTGGICAELDKARPLAWMEHWVLEFVARMSIISLLDYLNADRRQDHAKEIMHLTAWLGSWGAYKVTV